MNILVTGSEGFVGKEVVRELSTKHSVKGYSRADDILNLPHLTQEMKGMDIVIHAAARILGDLHEVLHLNVTGTAAVLESAHQAGVKTLIFLSTLGGLYAPSKIPIHENSAEADPASMSPYVFSKWLSEKVVHRFQEQSIIFRLAGIFGRGRKHKPLIQKMLQDKEVTVNNTQDIYDFIYLKDVVKAIRLAIEKKDQLGSESFILGSGNQMTVGEVAEQVQSLNNFKLIDKSRGTSKFSYDISKAGKLLDFQPIDLMSALKDFQKNL